MSAIPEQQQQQPTTRSRALADIGYNSILADHGTSSDDESPGETEFDERAAIGVSIGREQTRLLSPRTPAIEKAAALQSGSYFDGALDDDSPPTTCTESPDEAAQAFPGQLDGQTDFALPEAKPSPTRPPLRPPSPWHAGGRDSEKDRGSFTRSLLRDSFSSFNRRRASSGPESRSKSLFSTFHSALSAATDGIRGSDKLPRKKSFSSKRRSTLGPRSRSKTPEAVKALHQRNSTRSSKSRRSHSRSQMTSRPR